MAHWAVGWMWWQGTHAISVSVTSLLKLEGLCRSLSKEAVWSRSCGLGSTGGLCLMGDGAGGSEDCISKLVYLLKLLSLFLWFRRTWS